MQNLKGLSVESAVCLTPGMLGKQRLGSLPEHQPQSSRIYGISQTNRTMWIFNKSSIFILLLAIGERSVACPLELASTQLLPMPLGNSLTVTIDFWRARAPSSWVALHDFQDRRRQKRLTKCAAFKVGDKKWKKNKFLPLSWLVRLLFGWAGKSKSKSALLSDVLYIHDKVLGQRSRYDESEEVCVM